ncbi:hypothetical protein B9G69_001655 [Bdellovibrio sp. SKB1291214]|uniref:hypothetical protein n=1 Tax=Bdellovibrio sp. SKB1291214 TaxID=1732569 RepID=UPI000B514CF1|nr:hypothetical protein [Bdellovibrio sp. SKB1291214]UYL09279.1 hypothetical protein B9G69_001655 [Bdellovibrio sp. SKB1291214]
MKKITLIITVILFSVCGNATTNEELISRFKNTLVKIKNEETPSLRPVIYLEFMTWFERTYINNYEEVHEAHTLPKKEADEEIAKIKVPKADTLMNADQLAVELGSRDLIYDLLSEFEYSKDFPINFENCREAAELTLNRKTAASIYQLQSRNTYQEALMAWDMLRALCWDVWPLDRQKHKTNAPSREQ